MLKSAVPFSNGSKYLWLSIVITMYPVAFLFTVTLINSFSPYFISVGVALIVVFSQYTSKLV